MGSLTETLSQERIAITGSSGYLGTQLVKKLSFLPILCLDLNFPLLKLPKSAIFKQCSVLDPKIGKEIEEFKPTCVIHLAFSVSPVHGSKIKDAFKVDFEGTKNVFEFSARNRVQQIIHMSSTLAYGAFKDNPKLLTEEHPLRAKSSFHYAYHKRIVEEQVCNPFINNHKKIKLTILRPCAFIGETLHNYVVKILKGKFLPVMRKGGDNSIQFAYIDDIVNAILRSIIKKSAGVYNITPDDAISMNEIAKLLPGCKVVLPEFLARLGNTLLWWTHLSDAPTSYLDYVRWPFVASNNKAKAELGWQPEKTSEMTLLSLVNKS
ncbi:MAG: NAD-dependent epimerase/dehydratase family protein [Candidatus Hodarchaeales archaeon]